MDPRCGGPPGILTKPFSLVRCITRGHPFIKIQWTHAIKYSNGAVITVILQVYPLYSHTIIHSMALQSVCHLLSSWLKIRYFKLHYLEITIAWWNVAFICEKYFYIVHTLPSLHIISKIPIASYMICGWLHACMHFDVKKTLSVVGVRCYLSHKICVVLYMFSKI